MQAEHNVTYTTVPLIVVMEIINEDRRIMIRADRRRLTWPEGAVLIP